MDSHLFTCVVCRVVLIVTCSGVLSVVWYGWSPVQVCCLWGGMDSHLFRCVVCGVAWTVTCSGVLSVVWY